MRVAKTKALISFAVTANLMCVFVFAYAERWFSHDSIYQLNKSRFVVKPYFSLSYAPQT